MQATRVRFSLLRSRPGPTLELGRVRGGSRLVIEEFRLIKTNPRDPGAIEKVVGASRLRSLGLILGPGAADKEHARVARLGFEGSPRGQPGSRDPA